ncbi:hypothetical protein BJX61DRAFT_541455 [Aspergillus egyptiacus]|nr:hypothetical protein BJX61DRAFT_541455 [Aspergillus egyptiacus]
MGFLTSLISDAIESKLGNSHSSSSEPQPQPQPGPSYAPGYDSAPQAPYPWIPRWDGQQQRWYFVNEQTGESSWVVPGSGSGSGSGSYGGPQAGYYGAREEQYGGYYGSGQGYGEQESESREKKDHSMLYAAGGAAVGVLGGAVLAHEAGEAYDSFEEKKDDLEQDVEDFPEDAARWTGEAVGEVEQVPDRIEDGVEDVVQDVEDVPEDVAEWTGEKVGEVERFGDEMEGAYDQGYEEGRGDEW